MMFEPLPYMFPVVEAEAKKYNIPNLKLINKACGNHTGEIEMFVDSRNGGCSSVLEPTLFRQQYPEIDFPGKITVPITTLDREVPSEHEYNFLNIDVQGYELEVLKGGSKTLEKIDYVYSEVSNQQLYKDCCLIDEIDMFLSGYNFKRVQTDWIGGTWGDALYIKSK